MKKTALYPWHQAAGARFAPFAGWDMPIQYTAGPLEEHRLCRRSVGLFDIDHMGQFFLSGTGAASALSSLVSGAVLDMTAGEARYSLLLNESGGIIDDLFIYRLEETVRDPRYTDPWFIVVNAGNRAADFDWFTGRLPAGLVLKDLSDAVYMIAVQGPRAVELLDQLARPAASPFNRLPGGKAPAAPAVSTLVRSTMGEMTIAGVPVLAGRTGYTGEDGAELYCAEDRAAELWEALLAGAAKTGIEAGPVGLAARDSLRFEAGMPLHGHEISPAITPPEALLSWACDFSKDFTGKTALERQKAQGLKRRLVTLNVTGGVPREGCRVLTVDSGTELGLAVAGMFCPATGTYSANAFVPPEYAAPGTKLAVEIRGGAKEAIVIKRPLYMPVYRKA
jgi:glycine cleavage system T protein